LSSSGIWLRENLLRGLMSQHFCLCVRDFVFCVERVSYSFGGLKFYLISMNGNFVSYKKAY